MKKTIMAIAHSKGGVGKTEESVLIIDALLDQNIKLKVYDNDSESPKLSTYKKAKAEHIQLYELDSEGYVKAESLNITKMDSIGFELENGKSDIVYVDNGSPSFQPFISCFTAEVAEAYWNMGIDFIVITIITADKITHRAPIDLLNVYGRSVKYLIIENEHFGKVEFDETYYLDAGVKYQILKTEKLTPAQLETLIQVRDNGLLLSEALTSSDFSLLQKSRISKIKNAFETPFQKILESFDHE
jgi:hypothetical protein